MNADAFLELLKRLPFGTTRAMFLIVDRVPAHRARKSKGFVATHDGKSRLFYLPHSAPDRNPDARAWKHLKAGKVCWMAVTDYAEFISKVLSSLLS